MPSQKEKVPPEGSAFLRQQAAFFLQVEQGSPFFLLFREFNEAPDIRKVEGHPVRLGPFFR